MASAGLLRILQALSKQPSPGPAPAFSHVHICRALLAIGDEGPIGRIELSRKLSLGEGAIRTIIRHLTQAKVIRTVRDGCVLAKRGTDLYNRLRAKLSRISFIDARQLSLDKSSAAILVRGASRLVRRGIEQRDAAIRAGATGACTLIVTGSAYVMPMAETDEWKLQLQDPLAREMEDLFHPKNRDAVIVVSAPDKALAEHGAIAAALTLLE